MNPTRYKKSNYYHHYHYVHLKENNKLWFMLNSAVILILTINQPHHKSFAQSIGFHPNLNLGFNPYLSPVFGYGLGIPYGAYNTSPLKNPWFSGSILGATFGGQHSAGLKFQTLSEKLHAKSILKKFGQYSPFPTYFGSSLKGKLAQLEQQNQYLTPYGLDYGYGKHYGASMLPNKPYKSTYGDFYNNPVTMEHKPLSEFSALSSSSSMPSPTNVYQQQQQHHYDNKQHQPLDISTNFIQPNQFTGGLESHKTYSIIKPLIKVGAILTTAAILGKKTMENPTMMKLNPAGMIHHK